MGRQTCEPHQTPTKNILLFDWKLTKFINLLEHLFILQFDFWFLLFFLDNFFWLFDQLSYPHIVICSTADSTNVQFEVTLFDKFNY